MTHSGQLETVHVNGDVCEHRGRVKLAGVESDRAVPELPKRLRD
jgi:hypothetical protein